MASAYPTLNLISQINILLGNNDHFSTHSIIHLTCWYQALLILLHKLKIESLWYHHPWGIGSSRSSMKFCLSKTHSSLVLFRRKYFPKKSEIKYLWNITCFMIYYITMGSQRFRHDWETEKQQITLPFKGYLWNEMTLDNIRKAHNIKTAYTDIQIISLWRIISFNLCTSWERWGDREIC